MKLQAGYIGDGISNIIKKQFSGESIFVENTKNTEILKLKGLLEIVSNFDVHTNKKFEIDFDNIPKVLAVQNNILTRGLPTRSPIFLEKLLEKIGLSEQDCSKLFEYKYNSTVEFSYSSIFKKLHLIYPHLLIDESEYLGKLDSNLEQRFLDNSHPIFKQILQSQRTFKSIVKNTNKENWVDFSLTLPYLFHEKILSPYKGDFYGNIYKIKVIEVDGPHHYLKENIYYDSLRDNLIEEVNSEVFRYPYYEIDKNIGADDIIDDELKAVYLENFNTNIQEELSLYTSLLLPISVARIQKFIIELFIRNSSLLERENLSICVIERDIPGAAIALKLFEDYVTNLNNLVEAEDILLIPRIQLFIIQDKQWVYDNQINLDARVVDFNALDESTFDIIIDHSVLVREGVYNFNHTIQENYYTLRSVHYVETDVNSLRQIYCSQSLKYKPLVLRNPDTSYSEIKDLLPSIEFFLQNIFRKKNFREGQLPIISRALQKLPVIGLLPTGGGKSLTYQIPVFLQPSLSIIVDPIKSLMEDQVRVLKENWIDNVAFANSSQSQYTKNKSVVDFKLGNKQMIFISPERFVIKEFRSLLSNIDSTNKGQSIGYCIIDEVHCVSEWGHDFRYDYLLLGQNAQEYCKSKDSVVSLMGLTATASFDVLADIERELQIKGDDVAEAIIMIENTVRPELFFRVVDVSTSADRSEILLNEMQDFSDTFEFFNNKKLLLESQRHHFDNFDPKDFSEINIDNSYKFDQNNQFVFKEKLNQLVEVLPDPYSAIVFCPVKGTKISDKTGEFVNKKGVRYNHELLKGNGITAGYFYGSDEDGIDSVDSQDIIQDHFYRFMNGTLSTMVCTKAFGMGIDKDDIRATFHMNYSSSLESLVQECGRAGRDKKVSIATILANNRTYYSFDYLKLTEYYKGLSDFDIKVIKQNLVFNVVEGKLTLLKFNSIEEFVSVVQACLFPFEKKDGSIIYLSDYKSRTLRETIIEKVDELLLEKSEDRDIHDFFFDNNFKGRRYELAQMESLFTQEVVIDKETNVSLYEVLEDVDSNDTFEFIIPFSSKLLQPSFRISDKFKTSDLTSYERNLILQFPFFSNLYNNYQINENKIFEAYKLYFTSKSIEDFWQGIETQQILSLSVLKELSDEDRYDIEKPFLSQRNAVETGRLIYRLHSIGFLKGYTKDYSKEIYVCKFYKAKSIHYYLDTIEAFFKRYQSEKTVEESIRILISSLSISNDQFFNDLLKILKYLTDFTYSEIASKRRKATGEIKDLIERIIESDKDEYHKNLLLKEEIYFYFNAKYARKGYIENGKNYSLVDDYYNPLMLRSDVLFKYIDDDLLKLGTEQNNYKHLIGTCKKMLRNLTETENKKDWLLHLLLSFAFYSTNNLSYRFDANRTLENGFLRLLNDDDFMNEDFEKIVEIFDFYFDKLKQNINEGNELLGDIHLIQNKVLQDIQTKMVENYINQLI